MSPSTDTTVQRKTQKLDLEPCEKCGGTIWVCRRITMQTPWPWPEQTDSFSLWQKQTWPWCGGILVRCPTCGRVWYGDASMQRFNAIRALLPMDGGSVRVQFRVDGRKNMKSIALVTEPRILARPKRRSVL